MNYNVEKLMKLLETYLNEARLSKDENQIVVLCSIIDEVGGLKKELEDRAKTADDGTISGYNFKKLIEEILEG